MLCTVWNRFFYEAEKRGIMRKYVQHQAPILPVKNLKETLEYYRDLLNFDIAWIWEDSYASVFNGDIEIHLSKTENVIPQSIYFFVENADRVYDFLTKQNVEIVKEIKSYPYGMREFVIREINGHIFRIGHGEKSTDEIESFSKSLPNG